MRFLTPAYPEHLRSGKLYDTGHFVLVDNSPKSSRHFSAVHRSNIPHTLELPELTLAIKGPTD